MEHLEAYNRKLLANILPVHVAEHFLNSEKNNDVSFKSVNHSQNTECAVILRNCTMNSAILCV